MPNNSTMQSGSDKNRVVWTQKKWYSGASNFAKEDFPYGFSRSQAVDFRTSPYVAMLPASLNESGSVVTDLVKWFDTTPFNLVTYGYGDSGNLYSRTNAGSWSLLRSVANSHGNGLQYFFGDDYLYYTTDSLIGRYGPLQGTPTFDDNFLGSVGGIPQNTNSLLLIAASSQYATAANATSLQITSDITLEAFFNANTLPAVGSSVTLLGKWDESTNHRSYKMDILGVSGFFGDGSDSSLTLSTNTTDAPIDSACTGSAGTQTLSATNASFVSGKPIYIFQMQGTGFGQYERNIIQSYTAGTITLATPLNNTYSSGAQVIQVKQYTNVTINGGVTWKPKAWNGTTGGILIFLYNGTFTNNNIIDGSGLGFRGGVATFAPAFSGEGTQGASSIGTNPNGNGGGGAQTSDTSGAGGGNGLTGANTNMGRHSGLPGVGGVIAGANTLSSIVLGGGGGGGENPSGGAGGNGGAIIMPIGVTFTNNGSILSNGLNGASAGTEGGGGGGAGGSILPIFQTGTLGTLTATAGTGGAGGNASQNGSGGNGGVGRIAIHYLISYVDGTETPGLVAIQDNTLVSTTTYQARIGVSSTGTNAEFLTQNLPTLTTGAWNRLSISWQASVSTALFYLGANYIGASTGTLTAINSNASLLYVAANKGASVVQNFLDGLIDDVRIWSGVQTSTQIFQNNLIQIAGGSAGLAAYYELNGTAADLTGNANNLTLVNSPTYSTSVPFLNSTTRLDIDQQSTATGATYAVPTTIIEDANDSLSFTPTLDPQKSISFSIAAKGTGNITVTVHDLQNHLIASVTVLSAALPTAGTYEFVFPTPWRIVINKTYHVHVTSTVNDATIVSSSSNNIRTAVFTTYYQFLVTDTEFHPVVRFLNKLVIGNERYLATWDGASYNANLIAFPPNTHVRCFGFWRSNLAIGTWQEQTDGNPNIYDWNSGKIYFWDGISLTFNSSIDVPEGQVNSLLGLDSDLYYFAGYQGQLFLYQGSYMTETGNGRGNLVRRIPQIKPNEFIEVFPQALSMWRGMLHFGLAANANTSAGFQRATYSYGSWQPAYPQALSCDYPISTGNTGTTVSIGAVYPVGQTLLQSWNDNGAYGVDQINFNNQAASYGFLEANVQDFDVMWHDKEVIKAKADHLALQTGESIVVKYAIDQGDFESDNSLTDSSQVLHPTYEGQGRVTTNSISDGRGLEFQVAVEMRQTQNKTAQGTTTVLLGLSALASNLQSETVF